jgi:hypothetical protein
LATDINVNSILSSSSNLLTATNSVDATAAVLVSQRQDTEPKAAKPARNRASTPSRAQPAQKIKKSTDSVSKAQGELPIDSFTKTPKSENEGEAITNVLSDKLDIQQTDASTPVLDASTNAGFVSEPKPPCADTSISDISNRESVAQSN